MRERDLDFLPMRPQAVLGGRNSSGIIAMNTDIPLGCVLLDPRVTPIQKVLHPTHQNLEAPLLWWPVSCLLSMIRTLGHSRATLPPSKTFRFHTCPPPETPSASQQTPPTCHTASCCYQEGDCRGFGAGLADWRTALSTRLLGCWTHPTLPFLPHEHCLW